MTTCNAMSTVNRLEWSYSMLGSYAAVSTAGQKSLARSVLNNDAYNAPSRIVPVGPSYAELDAALQSLIFAPGVKPLGLILDCVGRVTTTRNPHFIAAVMLPGGKEAFQVGPRGRIYADICHAVHYAAYLAFDRKQAA